MAERIVIDVQTKVPSDRQAQIRFSGPGRPIQQLAPSVGDAPVAILLSSGLIKKVTNIFEQLTLSAFVENDCRDLSYIQHYGPYPGTILVLIEGVLFWTSFEYFMLHSVSDSLRIHGDLLKQKTETCS
jgi:hypothetical protein